MVAYFIFMPTKDDLIRENHELRTKLEFAQSWMRREVATSISRIQQEQSQKNTRIAMKNVFETEWLDIFTRKVIQKFGGSLEWAPRYTLERLIDAEIYWNTLQQYPQMDALPIIIAYQKILDAWIEERLVAPWRSTLPHRGSQKGVTQNGIPQNATYPNPPLSRRGFDTLEQDIVNLIEKKYTLSIGRLYQILQSLRNNEIFWRLTDEFIQHVRSEWILDILISDEFFVLFQSLMEREVFSRKRHESKVTYSDARFTRDIFIDASEKKGLLEMMF